MHTKPKAIPHDRTPHLPAPPEGSHYLYFSEEDSDGNLISQNTTSYATDGDSKSLSDITYLGTLAIDIDFADHARYIADRNHRELPPDWKARLYATPEEAYGPDSAYFREHFSPWLQMICNTYLKRPPTQVIYTGHGVCVLLHLAGPATTPPEIAFWRSVLARLKSACPYMDPGQQGFVSPRIPGSVNRKGEPKRVRIIEELSSPGSVFTPDDFILEDRVVKGASGFKGWVKSYISAHPETKSLEGGVRYDALQKLVIEAHRRGHSPAQIDELHEILQGLNVTVSSNPVDAQDRITKWSVWAQNNIAPRRVVRTAAEITNADLESLSQAKRVVLPFSDPENLIRYYTQNCGKVWAYFGEVADHAFRYVEPGYPLWKPVSNGALHPILSDFFHGNFAVMGRDGEPAPLILDYARLGKYMLSSMAPQDGRRVPERHPGVYLQDGILTVSGVKGLEKEDYVREEDVLDYTCACVQNATCPEFERFIWDVLETTFLPSGDDNALRADTIAKVEFIQEYLGACLFLDPTQCQIHPILHGAGGNGKSTLIDVIRACFPSHLISAVDLATMDLPFGLQSMIGVKINLVSELTNREMQDCKNIKSLLTGDIVEVSRKNLPSLTMQIKAGHIFACNELPLSKDSTEGFYRKFAVINFEKSYIGRADPNLAARLRAEVPGIIRWAQEGAQRINAKLARGEVLSEPESSKLLKQGWRAQNDNVLRWILSSGVKVFGAETAPGRDKDRAGWVSGDDAYAQYKAFTGANAVGQAKFLSRMRAILRGYGYGGAHDLYRRVYVSGAGSSWERDHTDQIKVYIPITLPDHAGSRISLEDITPQAMQINAENVQINQAVQTQAVQIQAPAVQINQFPGRVPADAPETITNEIWDDLILHFARRPGMDPSKAQVELISSPWWKALGAEERRYLRGEVRKVFPPAAQ